MLGAIPEALEKRGDNGWMILKRSHQYVNSHINAISWTYESRLSWRKLESSGS